MYTLLTQGTPLGPSLSQPEGPPSPDQCRGRQKNGGFGRGPKPRVVQSSSFEGLPLSTIPVGPTVLRASPVRSSTTHDRPPLEVRPVPSPVGGCPSIGDEGGLRVPWGLGR